MRSIKMAPLSYLRQIYNGALLKHWFVNELKCNWLFVFQKNIRNSHRRYSARKGVLKNFEKFTEKRLCQSLFLNKFVDLRLATLLKNRLWQKCFPVNFAKFLRTHLLQNNSGRLLLLGWIFEERFLFRILNSCQIKFSLNTK